MIGIVTWRRTGSENRTGSGGGANLAEFRCFVRPFSLFHCRVFVNQNGAI